MIDTYSSFYYGLTVDETNFRIDFSEGLESYVAEVEVGEYTLSGSNSIAPAIEAALNLEGALNYIVSVSREERSITIQADGTFSLETVSGPNTSSNTLKLLCGFSQDQSGNNQYTSNGPAGREFKPQLMLQSYAPTTDNKKAIDANVNKSSSGVVEVYKFGDESFMECEIMFQTDLDYSQGGIIKNDPNGVQNLREFMEYLITKAPVEFMPDRENVNSFQTLILEKTRTDSKGTGFKIYEMYGRGFRDHYETKLLTFRLIEG